MAGQQGGVEWSRVRWVRGHPVTAAGREAKPTLGHGVVPQTGAAVQAAAACTQGHCPVFPRSSHCSAFPRSEVRAAAAHPWKPALTPSSLTGP